MPAPRPLDDGVAIEQRRRARAFIVGAGVVVDVCVSVIRRGVRRAKGTKAEERRVSFFFSREAEKKKGATKELFFFTLWLPFFLKRAPLFRRCIATASESCAPFNVAFKLWRPSWRQAAWHLPPPAREPCRACIRRRLPLLLRP